jgi:hypothetical protein
MPNKGLAPNFPATVQLNVAVRIAITDALGESWIREWRPPGKELQSAFAESSTLRG